MAASSTALAEAQNGTNVSGMRLLHTRLQQEAEKIRKWKIQTELELKQKVTCTTACRTTLVMIYSTGLTLQNN